MPRSRTSWTLLFVLLSLVASLGSSPAAALNTSPTAPMPDGSPWDPAYAARQGAVIEAEMKGRLLGVHAKALAQATAGMDDYDVTWYDLVMDLDNLTLQLTGTTTVRAAVVAASLDVVDLHLNPNMTVSTARSDTNTLAFARNGDVLSITLERTYLQGEVFTLEVDYDGNPAGDYFGWDSVDGSALIWTLSEPFGARDWWVCKDLNTDKADSVDLHVTVNDPLIVATVGLEQPSTVPSPGRTTYHWKHRYPIATYLVSLAVHPYTVIVDSYQPAVGPPMPILHYSVPSWATSAQSGYAVTPAMMSTFAAAFGEYPFVDEKYAHAHFTWGGGMEHQTCSSMLYWYYGEGIIAHELGHQWFGDMITCADFHHIWLNEGFARWMEAYWLEQSQGQGAYEARMANFRYLGAGSIYVEDTSDFAAIFDADLTYNKASWVVHMLRWVLGEQDFLAGLAAYRAQYGHGSATTEDLQAVLESVSGRDLTNFFQRWIYGEYYPDYLLSWANVPQPGGDGRVTVRIEQAQAFADIFDMPLEIRIITDQDTVTHRVENFEEVTWYTFDVPGTPSQVDLDPGHKVLRVVTDQSVSDVAQGRVPSLRIVSNHPNPFNPQTTISFELATAGRTELVVFDAAGRRVRTVIDEVRGAGVQRAVWDGRDAAGRPVAAGVYFARLRAADGEAIHKMTLVK